MDLMGFYKKAKKKLYDVAEGVGRSAELYRKSFVDWGNNSANTPNWLKKTDSGLRSFSESAENTPKFNFAEKVDNPVGKFGATFAQETLNLPSKAIRSTFKDYGKVKVNPSYLVKRGAEAANIGVDAGSLFAGGGAAKTLAKEGFKKAGRISLVGAFKEGVKRGAKEGLAYGATSGALSGLQEGDNLKEQGRNALKQGAIGGVMGGTVGGVMGGAIKGGGHELGTIKKDIANFRNPYAKRVVTKYAKWEPVPDVWVGPDKNQMRPDINSMYRAVETVKLPFRPQSATGKFLTSRLGMNIEDINNKKPKVVSSQKLDDLIAQKRAKAEALVGKQIGNQKAGLDRAEKGFVAPQEVVAPAPKKPLPTIEEYVNGKTKFTPATDKLMERIRPEWRTDYLMIKDGLKNIAKEEAEYMMSLKDEIGGVGKYVKQGEDQIGGETGLRRFSTNPDWYREFFRKNGRAPRKYEVIKIAEENLKNGNGISAEKYNNTRKMLLDMEKESLKSDMKLANEFSPTYNKYQERAFNNKNERVKSIEMLMNYPGKLREIGYKKREIDRIGKDQAEKILKLGDLGYPKKQIDNIVKNFDKAEKIIKGKVSWSQLRDYYQRKRALDTNFLEGIKPESLGDINPLMAGGRDVYRNFEAVFGENFPKIKKELLNPFDAAKGNFIDEQRVLLSEVEENIVKKLGIKKGSDLDHAVVAFGEGKKSMENLQREFPNDWKKVVEADQWFKNKYTGLLDDLNNVREANFPTNPLYPESSKVIPHRKDYYRHGRDLEGFSGLRNLFEGPSSIDPALAATSDVTNPKTKWLSFAQRRKGDQNDFGAVEGYLDYVKNHAYAKHIDPFIQKFKGVDDEAKDNLPRWSFHEENPRRGLAEEFSAKLDPIQQITDSDDPEEIRKMLVDKGMSVAQSDWMSKELASIKDYDKTASFLREKLAKNTGDVVKNLFTAVSKGEKVENKANNFLVFIKNFSRDLAGKTNPIDRPFQENIFGRKALNVINWANSRFKANAVLGNLSSSVAQFFNIPQGFASAGARNSAKGLGRSLAGIFKESGPINQSNFIKERYFNDYSKFDEGVLANTKKFAVWMTGIGDKIGTKFIWNSHYEKALKERISNPIKYADDWTRKIVAGRGIGEVPIAQKAKITQLVAPFQLEVANQWHALRDIAKNDPRKRVMATKLLEFSVASLLMNRLAKEIRGSDVSFDPINAMMEAYGEYQDEGGIKGLTKAGGRMAGEVLSNIPGGQTFASAYPEFGEFMGTKILPNRKDFFGEGDPTRFGTGGLPAFSAVKNPLTGLIMPYGGKQLEKAYSGGKALVKGYAENNAGKVMTPVDRDITNVMKGLMFGKSGLNEVNDYYDNDRAPLSDLQSEKFKLSGNDRGYFEKIMGERAAANEKEKLKGGKIAKEAKQLSGEMIQLSNGKIYVESLDREFKTEKEASMAIAMDDMTNSEDNFRDLKNGWVLRKGEDGNVVKQRRDSYDSGLNNAKLSNYKKNDDLKNWKDTADKQLALLNKMLVDPSIDEADHMKIQNAIDTLGGEYQKYGEYGGFKKGRKAAKLEEKYRYPLVDPDFMKIQMLLSGAGPRKIRKTVRPLPLTRRRRSAVRRRKLLR